MLETRQRQLRLRLEPAAQPTPNTARINAQDAAVYIHPHLGRGNDPVKGSLLCALADIPAGTMIMADVPFGLVPTTRQSKTRTSPVICSSLFCRKLGAGSPGVQCPNACTSDVVWCNDECRIQDQGRHKIECDWLKRNATTIRREESEEVFAMLWIVVRLMAGRLLETANHSNISPKTSNSEAFPWQDRFQRGWEAVKNCSGNHGSWPQDRIGPWKRLVQDYFSDSSCELFQMTRDEILALICREETNSFGLHRDAAGSFRPSTSTEPRDEPYAAGLFPRALNFNHSCAPNVRQKRDTHVIICDNASLLLIAQVHVCFPC